MTKKFCCRNCFGDPGLIRHVIPTVIGNGSARSRLGNCGYCRTSNTEIFDPSALGEWFQMVLGSYTEDKLGKSLASAFAEDWKMFDHPNMDEAHVKELLAEILDDGDVVRRFFKPIDSQVAVVTPQGWDNLRSEIMHRNRWFLAETIDTEALAETLDNLIVPADELSEITELWHRARLVSNHQPLSFPEMGAPPPPLAGHGRANPAGIPYLYLGSSSSTAVSEVRPHTGQMACVAKFKVDSNTTIVDLRNPRKRVSPFLLKDADKVITLRSSLPLLERLGQELSRPVDPSSAPYEYIPSQYLCEFIKTQGFDGVIYRSSVSTGTNMALFRPDHASLKNVRVVHVDRVTVEIQDPEITASAAPAR